MHVSTVGENKEEDKGLPKRSIYYCRGWWEIAATSDKSPFRCIQRPVLFRSVNLTNSDRWFGPGR